MNNSGKIVLKVKRVRTGFREVDTGVNIQGSGSGPEKESPALTAQSGSGAVGCEHWQNCGLLVSEPVNLR